jgi:hypothetical protein
LVGGFVLVPIFGGRKVQRENLLTASAFEAGGIAPLLRQKVFASMQDKSAEPSALTIYHA